MIFDVSKEVGEIEGEVRYWLEWIESKLGEEKMEGKVMLIATKLDILEGRFEKKERQFYLREALLEINGCIQRVLKKQAFHLKLHVFKQLSEEFLFFAVRSKEQDTEKCGITKVCKLICRHYDNINNTPQSSLFHKQVYDEIQKLNFVSKTTLSSNSTLANSVKNASKGTGEEQLPEKTSPKKSGSKNNENTLNGSNNVAIKGVPLKKRKYGGKMTIKKGEEVLKGLRRVGEEEFGGLIELSFLQSNLKEKFLEEKTEEERRMKLEQILRDFHKMRLIIYFEHSLLKQMVVYDPLWLVKITILFFILSLFFSPFLLFENERTTFSSLFLTMEGSRYACLWRKCTGT